MAKLESKAAAKKRLQAEGRWKEAVAFREGLKKQGVSPAEAHQRMVQQFQPLNGDRTEYSPPMRAERGEEPSVPVNGSRPRRWRNKKHRVDWRRDVEWVYQNLDRSEPRGAPSAGALAMHAWARGHQAEFFANFVLKALTKAEKEPERERTRDGKDALKYLEEYMAKRKEQDPPSADRCREGKCLWEGGLRVEAVARGWIAAEPCLPGQCRWETLKREAEARERARPGCASPAVNLNGGG
jgi:hypothetical protein